MKARSDQDTKEERKLHCHAETATRTDNCSEFVLRLLA